MSLILIKYVDRFPPRRISCGCDKNDCENKASSDVFLKGMVETSLPLVLDFSCSPWLLSTRILKIKQIQRNFRLDVNLRRFELKADKKEKTIENLD